MNPAQLLSHFDRISEAPDAVPRLRRFILGLAVRGKLVEHDQENESASTMLERVRTERARLVREQRIATTRSLPPIEETEVPFALPVNWAWVRVGDVFLYDAGDKREPRELDADRWLVELEDIERDTSVILARLIVADRHSLSTKSEFRAGDILYGKLRPYLNKVVVAREAGYSTTEIVAIRSFVPFCAEYSCLAFRRPDFVEYVDRLGRGTKMPRLRTPDALMALFPLPPLAEQYRIAAKVDELMALCDRLAAAQDERERRRDGLAAASLRRLSQPVDAGDDDILREHARFHLRHLHRLTTRPDQIVALRHTVLSLAVRGRLVSQDLNDEPALVQLAASDVVRAATARVDRRANQERNTLLAAEEKWATPPFWEWRALADLVLFIDYRGRTPKKIDGGVRLITAKNIKKGFVSLSPEEFVSETEYEAWMTRGIPRDGDVLFTTEAPMGNAAVVHLTERFALAQRVITFRPYGAIHPDFLVLQLLSEPFQVILGKTATGLTAKGIKAAKLKRLPIVVPPLAEQRRIVAKVHELIAVCDRLKAQLLTAQTESRRFLEAALHEALTGAA